MIIGHYEISYYALCYVTAFVVCFVILIVEGRQRGLPTLPWLLVIVTGFIFFVLGCRIFALSAEDWRSVVTYHSFGQLSGMVMLGGLLLSVTAIFAAKRLLKLDDSALDAYGFIIPVGMCIQRVGCLIGGCCHGRTSDWFAVRYGKDTLPFLEQTASGVIPNDALHTLPLHAVQLYESLGCLCVILILLPLRSFLKSPGSFFYASGIGYYIVRFFTEFFRSPKAYAVQINSWFHLNSIQWMMLILIFSSVAILLWKERHPRVRKPNIYRGASLQMVLCFLFLVLSFAFASKWLSAIETFVIYVVLITTAGHLLFKLFNRFTVPKLRLTSLCLLLLSMICMSQTYPEFAESDSTKISYNTISIGALFATRNVRSDGYTCGTQGTSSRFDTNYQIGGLGFSRTSQKGIGKSLSWGISGFAGEYREDGHAAACGGGMCVSRNEISKTYTTFGANPYFQWDAIRIGVGAGVHVGNLLLTDSKAGHESPETLSSAKESHAFPQIYFRFGRLDRMFGEVSFARNFPSSFPGLTFQANIGASLKHREWNKGVMRIGTSNTSGLIFSLNIPAGNHFVIEPYVGVLKPIFSNYDDVEGTLASLNIYYKFAKSGEHRGTK